MEVPSYYLPRPPMDRDAATLAAFERLYADAVARGDGGVIDYTLPIPRWQLLCYLADNKEIVLHGSGETDIARFEPRKSNDVDPFGDRSAVYAASDGIWPIFFAITDKVRYNVSLVNACFRIAEAPGELSHPFYFFSITEAALRERPWRRGMIYLLPRGTFERQPPKRRGDAEIDIAQWASLVSVTPLAKLPVGPDDFPFLAAIRGHDDKTLFERATADPEGFPWMDEG